MDQHDFCCSTAYLIFPLSYLETRQRDILSLSAGAVRHITSPSQFINYEAPHFYNDFTTILSMEKLFVPFPFLAIP